MTTTQTSTAAASNKNTKLSGADVIAAKNAAAAIGSRTAPWEDLAADPKLQKEPRKNSTIDVTLTLLRERGAKGATLVEIQKALEGINMGHHDAKALLRWMSKDRGWGFHMKKDEHIVLRVKSEE